MDRRFVLWIFILSTSVGFAQVNQYMVFFTDKTGTPHSISNPATYLSAKAIQRRVTQQIAIEENDLPVNPVYIQDIKNTGASVIYKSKWLNGVLVSCDETLVPVMEALPQVRSVEYVAPGAHASAGGRKKSKNDTEYLKQASTDTQLYMLGMDAMHADGYRGDGITIAVFDGGFLGADQTPPFAHIFSENRFNASASYNFIQRNNNVFLYDDHGTRVWSVIAGYADGSFVGGAYKANFQLYVTEVVPTEYRIEEYYWLFAAERADSAGVDIINSSLGYNIGFDDPSMDYSKSEMDGKTAVVTRAAQFASDKGMLVVVSAGNEGLDASWRIITAPADAKDVLAVGSINSFMVRSPTSSIGPTADERIKPDVVALGSGTSVVRANGTITTGSGTSFSAPLVTSLAAGIWQHKTTLTNKELLRVIRESASMGTNPDNFLGHGLPGYLAALNYIELAGQQELIAVFPNPVVNNSLSIRPKKPEDFDATVVSIMSTQGQRVFEQKVEFGWSNIQFNADISALSAGIYILQVVNRQARYSWRIVKY
ncbi:MAG: S8 family serine peptidase [Cyclobacteriaceae bacterium]|nr:S8 family serine peptidase [Cyclobacteriaceae bacterium]UYN85302.1 MAG: S8 family serine peptidase [Cyclobacteriaceae bacterium]